MVRTKEALIEKLKVLNVTLAGTETFAQLTALLKIAKADAKTSKVGQSTTEKSTEVVPTPKGKAKSSVHFKLKSGKRVFTKDEHGASFNDVADEFHKTNEQHVISREHDVA